MRNRSGTTNGASAKSADPVVALTPPKAAEPSYTPLDINDPDGRFGDWMPGDDPDDWR